MSKEFDFSRRENSLVTRFIAQPLFNDFIFPKQDGIHALFNKAVYGDGTPFMGFSKEKNIEYFFLFDMKDFGGNSEVDILLRDGKNLYMIEVKAFTNPNTPNVKRNIVKYITELEFVIKNSDLFDPVEKVIPVLLFSTGQYKYNNPSGYKYSFNYMNNNFLTLQGCCQKNGAVDYTPLIKYFSKKPFELEKNKTENVLNNLSYISKKLLFLTWTDVLDTMKHLQLNFNIINELQNKTSLFLKRGKSRTVYLA